MSGFRARGGYDVAMVSSKNGREPECRTTSPHLLCSTQDLGCPKIRVPFWGPYNEDPTI